jgi:hypothetical protein
MALVEDFAAFFSDFAVTATVGASSLVGMFDNGYGEAFEFSSGRTPTFLCVAANLPTLTLGTTTAVIGGITYTIVETKPDGFGLTTLVLEA